MNARTTWIMSIGKNTSREIGATIGDKIAIAPSTIIKIVILLPPDARPDPKISSMNHAQKMFAIADMQ